MIRIRAARERHVGQIVRVYERAFPPHEQGLPPSYFRESLRAEGTIALVAMDGDALRGYCIGTRWGGLASHDAIYAASLAVDPAAQGRGIGTALYREFLDAARRAGYTRVTGDYTDASVGIARRELPTLTEEHNGRTTRIDGALSGLENRADIPSRNSEKNRDRDAVSALADGRTT